MPENFDSNEQIAEWIDFVNTLGYDIKITYPRGKTGNDIKATLIRENTKTNYYFLFALNLIRYLWSTHYDHLPAIILELRKNKEFAHLDNWEILQLGHKVSSKKHFNDMSPVNSDESNRTCYITSEKFFKARQFENLNGHLSTFNIKMPEVKTKEINDLRKKKDYLGIYNLLSTKVNNISEVSRAKCLDSSNFKSELSEGSIYEIVRVLKNTVKIKNKNYIVKLYNKDRFKLL